MNKCERCSRRAGAVAALGVERLRIAEAVGQFTVLRTASRRESTEYLCADDVRSMRASFLFTVTPA